MITFITRTPEGEWTFHSCDTDDLQEAFGEFVDQFWNDEVAAAVGVWDENFLIAQVLPVYSEDTAEYEARLFPIPPP